MIPNPIEHQKNVAVEVIGAEHTQEPDASSSAAVITEGLLSFLSRINESRGPMVVVLLLIFAINAYLIGVQLTVPAPQNPWESGLLTEAWRFSQNQAVYSGDHASHMYGPLAHILIAETFKFTGPNVYAGRILSLIASLVTVSLLAWIISAGASSFYFWASWILLFGINSRVINYFVESRPDMLAIVFSLAALILFYRDRVALALGFLLVAFFFKQTAVIVCLIPLVAFLLERKMLTAGRILKLAAPIFVFSFAILSIRLKSPIVYHFMVEVPNQYPVPFMLLAQNGADLIATVPLFFVALALWIHRQGPKDRVTLWFLASVVVTVPTCLVLESKAGGTYNSLLPAFFALIGFACLEIRRMPRSLRGLVGLLACATIFVHIGSAIRTAKSPHGDTNHILAVRAASSLGGSVVCPDDPFLVVLAKRQAHSSVFLEYDEEGWIEDLPIRTNRELESADYVIQVRKTRYPFVTDDRLASRSFILKQVIEDSYAVWERPRLR